MLVITSVRREVASKLSDGRERTIEDLLLSIPTKTSRVTVSKALMDLRKMGLVENERIDQARTYGWKKK